MECLDRESFYGLAEARVIASAFRIKYNEQRPHASLGFHTPGEFAARCQTGALPPTPGI
jgi:transposase InsO family protein